MDTNYMNEVEKLARTLRANRVAQTESEARRMAEEMLATSKKVHDDFKARDAQMYSQAPKSTEMENAHKIMEKISANLAKGGGRVNVAELDLNKPLKELIPSEPEPVEHEDDDAVVVNDESLKKVLEESPTVDVAVAQASNNERKPDDFDDDNDDDDGSEEEKSEADDEFSVKEL